MRCPAKNKPSLANGCLPYCTVVREVVFVCGDGGHEADDLIARTSWGYFAEGPDHRDDGHAVFTIRPDFQFERRFWYASSLQLFSSCRRLLRLVRQLGYIESQVFLFTSSSALQPPKSQVPIPSKAQISVRPTMTSLSSLLLLGP